MKLIRIYGAVLIVFTMMILAGCGGDDTAQKNKDFFTSGSREADQRADQRMAKSNQLKGGSSNAENAKASLYDRLGGQEGIQAVIDDFVPRVLADPQVNFERKGVKRGGFSIHAGKEMEWHPTPESIDKLKKHFVQFISLKTGGPTEYDGGEMKSVHNNMHITNTEFDAAIGDFKASLDKLRIPNQEQKELLSIIESTRPQVAEQR